MPIAVEVVPPAQFAAWIASKGGHMAGSAAPAPDSTAISPVSTSAVPAPAAPQPAAGTPVKAAPAAPAPQNPNVANRATQSK
jgi:cytochrome c oxidase subunit 2